MGKALSERRISVSEVIALLTADIHLSHMPPVARSAEPDWYETMGRYLTEVDVMSRVEFRKGTKQLPVICAGDIFDRWNAGPELINFAIDYLPKMYAVAGQHDLPHHNLDDLHRSAYWTLVEAGTITNLESGRAYAVNDMVLYGFPWGVELGGLIRGDGNQLLIAVTHAYIYDQGHRYPGASKTSHLGNFVNRLRGFDVAVFGDNHSSFLATAGNCNVINCGCLFRRKQDERSYKPSVGLLYDDGSIKQRFLDTSQDKWIDELPVTVEGESDLTEFLAELKSADSEALDFRDAVLRHLKDHDVTDGVKAELLEALEKH